MPKFSCAGFTRGSACRAQILVIVVPELKKLALWYLLTTDLELGVRETVQAYARRAQVEVNFDEAKELGLGHYQVRSDSGIRRWPVLICLAQVLLNLAMTKKITPDLPTLNWSCIKRKRLSAKCDAAFLASWGRLLQLRNCG